MPVRDCITATQRRHADPAVTAHSRDWIDRRCDRLDTQIILGRGAKALRSGSSTRAGGQGRAARRGADQRRLSVRALAHQSLEQPNELLQLLVAEHCPHLAIINRHIADQRHQLVGASRGQVDTLTPMIPAETAPHQILSLLHLISSEARDLSNDRKRAISTNESPGLAPISTKAE